MNKQEFLAALRARLSGLPKEDVEERLHFFGEMIDDRMEEGIAEEAAVSEIGSVDEIATQIVADIPLGKIAREKIKPKRRMRAWEIVLLVLGSPIWLSLAVAAFAVFLALYAVLWSLVAVLWAVFASFAVGALGGVLAGSGFAVLGHVSSGIALIGVSLACGGVSIFLFFGCGAATKGTLLLTRRIALGIKKCVVGKEEVR